MTDDNRDLFFHEFFEDVVGRCLVTMFCGYDNKNFSSVDGFSWYTKLKPDEWKKLKRMIKCRMTRYKFPVTDTDIETILNQNKIQLVKP